jgi:D-alanyl-D-alanine carboxypeptidase (penicillin-binding protein 5/6)
MLEDRLDETVTVTQAMLDTVSGYNMKLKDGENITIIDRLKAAICGSYNDAAYVLAHLCANDIEGFVSLMNQRALDLGANSTKYTNPIGYPDHAAMVTTAEDTLKIATAASDNELYMEICSATKYLIPSTNKSSERTFYNRNALISSGSGTQTNYFNSKCFGMNAGFSGEAGGWSVVTLAKDDGADYICIALGGQESEDGSQVYAYKAVNSLINWACKTYNVYGVFPANKDMGTIKVKLSGVSGGDAAYVTESPLSVYIPTDSSYDTELSYNILLDSDSVTAPISAGAKVGIVKVYCNGEVVGECELVLNDSYEVNGIMLVIDKLGEYTKSRAFIATVICFVVLFVITLVFLKSNKKIRGRRRQYVRK